MDFSDDTKLLKLPFAGAIYSMANGENHYMSGGQMKNLSTGIIFKLETIKGIFRKLRKYSFRTLNRKIREEFGIYPLNQKQ